MNFPASPSGSSTPQNEVKMKKEKDKIKEAIRTKDEHENKDKFCYGHQTF